MALNTKGKKTSLDDKAFIYEKRDEEESEKSKWSRMDKKQKFTHFKTYYLPPLFIAVLVLVVVGFLVYNDVIMKKDVVYQCALLNESAMEMPVEDFGKNYVRALNLDPEKNIASFQFFYTNSEIASQTGSTAATDLTQVSSMIYAATLDSMIAGEEDFKTYLNNQFFVDLTELLREDELEIIQDYLYIPDTAENTQKHPYGIYLDQSSVYQKIFEDGGGIVEKPIYGVLFNSEHKEESRQFLYYVFPQLKEKAAK